MRLFLIQIKQYGFAQIEAADWADAQSKAKEMTPKEFDMSNDADVDVLDEVDDSGGAIDPAEDR